MADYTFIEMKEWFYNNAPKIINEKYFLYVMGSIFLLGIFTKWLAAFGYGRMIRKACLLYTSTKINIRNFIIDSVA